MWRCYYYDFDYLYISNEIKLLIVYLKSIYSNIDRSIALYWKPHKLKLVLYNIFHVGMRYLLEIKIPLF